MAANFGVADYQIIEGAKIRVPGWERGQTFRLSPLSGGMSNLLFLLECTEGCSDMPNTPRKVIARLLSPQLDHAIDRAREMRIVKFISTTGIGPRLFGSAAVIPEKYITSGNITIRYEEFVDGRTLGIKDLRADEKIAIQIAEKVARLHVQRPNLDGRRSSTQMSSREQLETKLIASPLPGFTPLERIKTPTLLSVDSTIKPSFKEQLENYQKLVKNISQNITSSIQESLGDDLRLLLSYNWADECKLLLKLLERGGGPVVLSHSDLQEGNWILEKSSSELYLIDYEYACYNYRAFDLGNLLCEHTFDYSYPSSPGYEANFSAYPSLRWQLLFFINYLATFNFEEKKLLLDATKDSAPHFEFDDSFRNPLNNEDLAYSCDVTLLRENIPNGLPLPKEISKDDLVKCMLEARLGILASHLYWCLWSAVMSAGKRGLSASAVETTSKLEESKESAHVASGAPLFDYANYGATRLREYQRLLSRLRQDAPDLFVFDNPQTKSHHVSVSTAPIEWITKQAQVRDAVESHSSFSIQDIATIGGCDVTFDPARPEIAVGCVTSFSYPNIKLEAQHQGVFQVNVPYIPGYLAFREAPIYKILWQTFDGIRPEILLVDGNGLMHPQQAGIASHLGVLLDIPTIGVSKTLFIMDGINSELVKSECKKYLKNKGDYLKIVGLSGTVLGAALRTKPKKNSTENDSTIPTFVGEIRGINTSEYYEEHDDHISDHDGHDAETDTCKPVFVSIGHKIDLSDAIDIVLKCSMYRIPEPIRQADKLSRVSISNPQLFSDLGAPIIVNPEGNIQNDLGTCTLSAECFLEEITRPIFVQDLDSIYIYIYLLKTHYCTIGFCAIMENK